MKRGRYRKFTRIREPYSAQWRVPTQIWRDEWWVNPESLKGRYRVHHTVYFAGLVGQTTSRWTYRHFGSPALCDFFCNNLVHIMGYLEMNPKKRRSR